MSSAGTLHLVDASVYVFRGWHAMPDQWHDSDGWPLNAVHGFARFLLELLERERPSHVLVAFDEALGSCFRNQLYPAYKANREEAPPELKRQFAYCRLLCEALGLPTVSHADYEADDLLGSALTAARAHGMRGVIVSADKDLSQLLDGDDEQFDFSRGQRWRQHDVKARFGVHAHQIADYLALSGDAVDNIPGVGGIGRKTAAVLLAHFGDLDSLLARIDEIPFLRLRGAAGIARRLHEQREHALLWRELTRIHAQAPLGPEIAPFLRRRADADALNTLCETLRFGPFTRSRLQNAGG